MNITERKKLEEILAQLGDSEQLLGIIGCGTCATSCQTGGAAQVEELKAFLEENGRKVIYTNVVQTECDERQVKKELRELIGKKIHVDAIFSMGCGNGNAVVADLLDIPVYPTNNSMFVGSMKRLGVFEEKCSHCGDCVTGRTAGICPVTACAKSLMNGPCGGSYEGKCEVDPKRPCAWALIYERLKKQGKLHYHLQYHEPKSFVRNVFRNKLSNK